MTKITPKGIKIKSKVTPLKDTMLSYLERDILPRLQHWEIKGDLIVIKPHLVETAKKADDLWTLPMSKALYQHVVTLSPSLFSRNNLPEIDFTKPTNTISLVGVQMKSGSLVMDGHGDLSCTINVNVRLSTVALGGMNNTVSYVTLEYKWVRDSPAANFTIPTEKSVLKRERDSRMLTKKPLPCSDRILGMSEDLYPILNETLKKHFPLWEIKNGDVYVTQEYHDFTNRDGIRYATKMPAEFFQFILGNHNQHAKSEDAINVEFDFNHPRKTVWLNAISYCLIDRVAHFEFRLSFSLVKKGKKANEIYGAHVFIPTEEATPEPIQMKGEKGMTELVNDDDVWMDLVAALIFSAMDYGTFDEYANNIKSSFFITPTITLAAIYTVRSDAEMDEVINLFQDVGYKYPDLMAIYHVMQFLRLSKNTNVTLTALTFNSINKTCQYTMGQAL